MLSRLRWLGAVIFPIFCCALLTYGLVQLRAELQLLQMSINTGMGKDHTFITYNSLGPLLFLAGLLLLATGRLLYFSTFDLTTISRNGKGIAYQQSLARDVRTVTVQQQRRMIRWIVVLVLLFVWFVCLSLRLTSTLALSWTQVWIPFYAAACIALITPFLKWFDGGVEDEMTTSVSIVTVLAGLPLTVSSTLFHLYLLDPTSDRVFGVLMPLFCIDAYLIRVTSPYWGLLIFTGPGLFKFLLLIHLREVVHLSMSLFFVPCVPTMLALWTLAGNLSHIEFW